MGVATRYRPGASGGSDSGSGRTSSKGTEDQNSAAVVIFGGRHSGGVTLSVGRVTVTGDSVQVGVENDFLDDPELQSLGRMRGSRASSPHSCGNFVAAVNQSTNAAARSGV